MDSKISAPENAKSETGFNTWRVRVSRDRGCGVGLAFCAVASISYSINFEFSVPHGLLSLVIESLT